MGFLGSLSEKFNNGGVWMWFILGLFVVAVVITIERFFALYIKRKPVQKINALGFEEGIRKGDLEEVLKVSRADKQSPIHRTVAIGTEVAMNMGGKDEIHGRMEEVILEETEEIEKRTPLLAMIANVATLTGLLGTIAGLIKAFASISEADTMEKATLLSSGVSEAMNTTAFGLIVAIPTLIFYGVLTSRSQTLTDDLNQAALKVYNWLSHSFNPLEFHNRPSSEF